MRTVAAHAKGGGRRCCQGITRCCFFLAALAGPSSTATHAAGGVFCSRGQVPLATEPSRRGVPPGFAPPRGPLSGLVLDGAAPRTTYQGRAGVLLARVGWGGGRQALRGAVWPPGWGAVGGSGRAAGVRASKQAAGAGPGEAAGETARITVLVGGEERAMDERSLREAVEQSDEDSLVTVRIRVLRSLGAKRLDAFLSESIPIMSRSSLTRTIKAASVTVNDKVPKASAKLREGDEVVVSLPPPPSTDVEGEDIPLDVLLEDDHVILVNKQSDLVVHPAPTAPSGTLVNALVHHFQQRGAGQGLSPVGADKTRPGIVHRLDRNTTGVMVIAKTEGAHWSLYEQFARRATDKRYLALVQGKVSPPRGLIDLPLGRHPRDPTRFAVTSADKGKVSQTEYMVRELYEGYSLVELKLLTGRTHQIRVHLAHLKHPLVGDNTYGGKAITVGDVIRRQQGGTSLSGNMVLLGRQALHSCTLRFKHPDTQLPISVLAKGHEDMARTINLLRQHRLLEIPDPAKTGAIIPMDKIFPPESGEMNSSSERSEA